MKKWTKGVVFIVSSKITAKEFRPIIREEFTQQDDEKVWGKCCGIVAPISRCFENEDDAWIFWYSERMREIEKELSEFRKARRKLKKKRRSEK